jgi:hypothetical protein
VPQALCRVAAVHGALYMLRTPLAALLVAPPSSDGADSHPPQQHAGAAWLDGQQAAWEAAEEARKAAARAEAAASNAAATAAASSPSVAPAAPVPVPATNAPAPPRCEPMAVGVVTAEGQLLRARAVVSGAAYVPRAAPSGGSLAEAAASGGPWAVLGATVVVTDAPLALPHGGDAHGGGGSNSGASLVVLPPDTRLGGNATPAHDHAVLVLQQGAGTAVTGDGRHWLVHVLTQAAVPPAGATSSSSDGSDEPAGVAAAREAAVLASAAVADALFQGATAATAASSADGSSPSSSSSAVGGSGGAAALPAEAPAAAAAADDGRPRCLWRVSYSHAAPTEAAAPSAPGASPGLPRNWHVLPPPPALTLHPLTDALGAVRRTLQSLYGPGFQMLAATAPPAEGEGEGEDDDVAGQGAAAAAAAAAAVTTTGETPSAQASTSAPAVAAPAPAAAESEVTASSPPAAAAAAADGDLDVAAALALLREAEESGLDL